jgi:multicomponent Na+:H+ antiporter subunit D
VVGKALVSTHRPLVLKTSPSRRRELIALTVALCAVVLGLVPLRSSQLLQIGRPSAVGVAQR